MSDQQHTEPAADVEEFEALDLDQHYAENRSEPYPFRWAGHVWHLPNVYELPINLFGLLDKVQDTSTPDAATVQSIADMVEVALGPEQWNQIRGIRPLPFTETVYLFDRWMKWCGVNPGESRSSATSSNGTAGRSKRTSKGSTASGSARRSTARASSGSRRGKS